jgi:hypothetical protein
MSESSIAQYNLLDGAESRAIADGGKVVDADADRG